MRTRYSLVLVERRFFECFLNPMLANKLAILTLGAVISVLHLAIGNDIGLAAEQNSFIKVSLYE
jgi:hypothetical protein